MDFRSAAEVEVSGGTEMTEMIFMVEEDMEGGFVAKAINQSIITQADSIGELKQNILDAVDCHFDDPAERPKIIKLHIVREEVIKYA